jgi:uncharacterized protein (TIGR01244 family)
MPGVTNFARIDGSSGFAGDSAGFGGATEPSAMAALKNEGFATVINLRLAKERGADIEADRAAAEQAGLKFVHLPFFSQDATPEVVDNFLATVGNADNQPVYIYCGSGTRAVALWMTGRVLVDGWDIETASTEAGSIAAMPERTVALAENIIDSTQP